MVSNKYHRDFNSYGALKRPGRIDRTVFQDIPDCGDGFGGIQWMMLKAFGTLLFPRFVIEGCEYNGVDTMSNGYIMWDGVPIEVDEQAIVVANGEFLYVNQHGVAHTTAVQVTAQAGVMIYERDALAVGYDIIFRLNDNVLKVFGLDAQNLRIHHNVVIDEDVTIGGDVAITGDLDVDGDTTLDDTEIDGTLNVTGITDMQDDLEMNDNEIKDIKQIDGGGDAIIVDDDLDMTDHEITDIKQIDGGGDPIIVDDEFNMNAHQISNLLDPTALQDAVTINYLRSIFMPVGTVLMYNTVGAGWTDNITMVGWFKCNAANHITYPGVPDLTNKFIRSQAASGLTGGADTHTLVTAEVPGHTHNAIANHDHGSVITSGLDGGHTHTLRCSDDVWHGTNANTGSNAWTNSAWRSGMIGSVANHSHTVTLVAEGGHTHSSIGGDGAHQNMPSYYSLIFVCRAV